MNRAIFVSSLCALSLAAMSTTALADGSSSPAPANSTSAASGKVQLMPAEKEAALRKLLPKFEDPEMTALVSDERTIFYTEDEMPRCHQDWDGSLPGLHSPYYNISANSREPYGNGNREFPWGHPAGTHRAAGVYTFRFFRLPQDEQGRTLPVTWYRRHLRHDTSPGYAWTYPVGTVFGEVLCLRTPDNRGVAFEVRIRRRDQYRWEVDAFRPFPTAESLAERITELRSDWESKPSLAKLVSHVRQPQALPVGRLTDNHPRRVFDQQMGIDVLPPIGDDKLVIELLTTTPFRSAHGELWRKGTNNVYTAAPTTQASFHIVPKGYDGGFVEVDTHSCMRCHETANSHVRDFDSSRDWYGRVRGSDGIFSWHPFDPSSISRNGSQSAPRLRGELIRSGLLAPYDRRIHPARLYARLRGLDQ